MKAGHQASISGYCLQELKRNSEMGYSACSQDRSQYEANRGTCLVISNRARGRRGGGRGGGLAPTFLKIIELQYNYNMLY